ncbi:hypothetical protein ACH4GM_37000 [Streptomyces coeruleorubidus]|uniref:hypothetical protein n=1 Tax=Streptomyces coeruleorubidus TaxID=116188 RepID=UPI003791266E
MRVDGDESLAAEAADGLPPGEFQPTGGFADDAVVENSRVGLTDTPGIGFESKAAFYTVLRALHS